MDRIERYFDIAIKSPDGIKKLREMILSLAMQGKLVPQDPNDPPASELLKEIEAEKKKLIKEGKIKKQDPLPPIKPEDVPYALPAGWEWVRLGEVVEYNGRPNMLPSEILPEVWVLDLEDIEKDSSRILYRAKYSERESKSTKSVFCAGDVLYGKLRPYLNKVVVADEGGVCTTEIVPIVPCIGIFSGYLGILLKRPDFLAYVNSKSYGVKMPRLGTTDAIMSLHPIPPLAEQKRIVDKVDALMALCDKLEAERDARNAKRVAVQKTALDRLLAAQDQAAFDSAWAFIARNFADLYSVPENVAELKKAILQLAVMGKLVPQDPNDQPASELLKEIEAEKKKLIKAGKIKKQEPLPPIKPEEVPYTLPAGWAWVRLRDLGYFQGGKTPSTNKASYWQGTIPWVSAKDMKTLIIHDSEDHVTEAGVASGLALIPINSVLMVVRSGILRRAFPVAINATVCTINQDLKALVLFPGVYAAYVLLMLRGFEKYILCNLTKAGMTVESVMFNDFCVHRFPLPPLAEQKRIVAKVDALMALCDELEQQLKDATDKQTALLNAVVAAM